MCLGKRLYKHRILNGNLGVKVGYELVPLKVKLAAQLKIHRNLPVIYAVAGVTHLLVVVDFCNRRPPVNDQLIGAFFRNGSAANVVALRLLRWVELKTDLGKIWRVKKLVHCIKLF